MRYYGATGTDWLNCWPRFDSFYIDGCRQPMRKPNASSPSVLSNPFTVRVNYTITTAAVFYASWMDRCGDLQSSTCYFAMCIATLSSFIGNSILRLMLTGSWRCNDKAVSAAWWHCTKWPPYRAYATGHMVEKGLIWQYSVTSFARIMIRRATVPRPPFRYQPLTQSPLAVVVDRKIAEKDVSKVGNGLCLPGKYPDKSQKFTNPNAGWTR